MNKKSFLLVSFTLLSSQWAWAQPQLHTGSVYGGDSPALMLLAKDKAIDRAEEVCQGAEVKRVSVWHTKTIRHRSGYTHSPTSDSYSYEAKAYFECGAKYSMPSPK